MKMCVDCTQEKPVEEFATRSAMCKPCHNAYTRRHYRENRQYYKDKARKNNDLIRERVREAKNKPCADCGESYPYYVMDFDHRSDKDFNISQMTAKVGWEKIQREIAKCDVVCSNCHRERTHSRTMAP